MKFENLVRLFVLSAVLLGGLVGCSSSDDDEVFAPVTQVLNGTFVTTGGATGTIELMRVSPATSSAGNFMAAVVDVMGSVTPAGGTATDITGTIDEEAGFFMASGGGYNLNGFFDEGLLAGGISTPGGGGGVFGALGSNSGMAQTFCGDWIENGAGTPGGLFSLTVQGNSAVAIVVDFADVDAFVLSNNSVSGNSVTLAAFPEQDIPLQATGTLSGASVSGTWTSSDGIGTTSGTFQGTAQACTLGA